MDVEEEAREQGKIIMVMNIFLYGFVTIITIISSINIINTVSTNIILRVKEIATLRAIGMDKRKLKKMLALESLYYGIYASLIGVAISIVLNIIMYRLFEGIYKFNYIFSLGNIVVGVVGTLTISLLSGLFPLRHIESKPIVEGIKEEN